MAGKKNIARLIPVPIIDRLGRQTTVYVKPNELPRSSDVLPVVPEDYVFAIAHNIEKYNTILQKEIKEVFPNLEITSTTGESEIFKISKFNPITITGKLKVKKYVDKLSQMGYKTEFWQDANKIIVTFYKKFLFSIGPESFSIINMFIAETNPAFGKMIINPTGKSDGLVSILDSRSQQTLIKIKQLVQLLGETE